MGPLKEGKWLTVFGTTSFLKIHIWHLALWPFLSEQLILPTEKVISRYTWCNTDAKLISMSKFTWVWVSPLIRVFIYSLAWMRAHRVHPGKTARLLQGWHIKITFIPMGSLVSIYHNLHGFGLWSRRRKPISRSEPWTWSTNHLCITPDHSNGLQEK